MTSAPPQKPMQSEAREVHLRDYWRIMWHSRLTVLGIFLVIVGATAAWTVTRTPIYRATAVVEVQSRARNLGVGQDVSGLGASSYSWTAEERYHNTQVDVIRSRDVAERVVNKLKLRTHPRFEAATDPVEAFRKGVMVQARRETGLIEVSIAGANPEEITHWTNEVARAYVRRNLDNAQSNVEEAVEMIESQVDRMRGDLKQTEQARLEALRQNNLYNTESQQAVMNQKLATWHAKLTEVQISKAELADILGQIRAIEALQGDLLSVPELAKDDTLRELARTGFELERQIEAAKVALGPKHPDYEKLKNEAAKNDIRVEERMGLILASLQQDYDGLVSQEQYLVGEIDKAEEFSFRVSQATSDYEIVKTDAESQKKVFDMMSRALNEVMIGLNLTTNNVAVLDEATVPRYPVSPRKKLNVMIGGILGLCLGIAAAFFLDYLDNTFRSPEDIEKYLGLSVLGVIPKIEEKNPASQRAVKEAYQSLRTSVIFSSKNRSRKIILVTSTGPQEGKSSTVANLGRTLAQAGDRTIILDCDLRRPTQHLHHDVDRETGLTNYLTGRLDDTDWSRFVKRDEETGLELLTCGPIPPSPSELLGSERFATLLKELRQTYEWILIDSPPASSLADSTLLAASGRHGRRRRTPQQDGSGSGSQESAAPAWCRRHLHRRRGAQRRRHQPRLRQGLLLRQLLLLRRE